MNPLQYSPQQSQNSPLTQTSSYLPPSLYGNIPAEASIDPGNTQDEVKPNPERQYIMEKITEIEKGLEGLFLKFYQVWLWILGLSSFGGFAYIIYMLAATKDTSNIVDMMAILLVLVLWIGIQSVCGLLSMYQKNVSKANITCWMMIFGVIPGVLLDVKLIVAFGKYPDPKDDWVAVLRVLIIAVSAQVLVHIGMSMFGAVKVRKILLERELLQEKLKRIDYSFRA